MLALLHPASTASILRAIDAHTEHEAAARLHAAAPTLVLPGGRDVRLRPRFGRVVAELIAGGRFAVRLEEAHQLFHELADEFKARVDSFWPEVDSGA